MSVSQCKNTKYFYQPGAARHKQERVRFCPCQPDAVRLLQLGYIGASPAFPSTAFSLRLLRMHHVLWKRCAVRLAPFSQAIDEFLDAMNPLILVPGTHEVRQTTISFDFISTYILIFRIVISISVPCYVYASALQMEKDIVCCCRCVLEFGANGKRTSS